jgi:hypothetical protein
VLSKSIDNFPAHKRAVIEPLIQTETGSLSSIYPGASHFCKSLKKGSNKKASKNLKKDEVKK